MKLKLFFILFVTSKIIISCDCPPLNKINSQELKKYDVIFIGTVDTILSIDDRGMATAIFIVDTVFKGNIEREVAIFYDAISSCMMSFEKGQKWLIYSKYKRFDYIVAEFCEHSRRCFSNNEDDKHYSLISQQSYSSEKEFLVKTLGVQKLIDKNKLNEQQKLHRPHNIQPSGYAKLILLASSLIVMVGIYWFFIKKRK